MANRYRGTIHIGLTPDIARRVAQHRDGKGSAFIQRYGCKAIVHAERYDSIDDAITREKALKKWNRDWKIRLIEEQNPDWEDRYADLVIP
ncbi:Excinuclease ABC, C subunit-like [Aurantiacibacter gangjinensis]|nr:Excinuclease ABC, C subunit-like [Aurantiacibacter gangjinensis]